MRDGEKGNLQGVGTSSSKPSTFHVFLVSFCLLCAAAIGLILVSQTGRDDNIEAPPEGVGSASCADAAVIDLVAGLRSEKEEEQVRSAEEILKNPKDYANRVVEICRAFDHSRFPKARVRMVRILGGFAEASDAARGSLLNALTDDKHHLVRLEAARALRNLGPSIAGSKQMKTAFNAALKDREDEICLEAMRFAFDNPDTESTKPILEYLGRGDAKHQCKAIEVLGRIKDPSAAPRLLELLQDETASTEVRARACGVLALMKYTAAEPVIRRIAEQKSGSELCAVAQESLTLYSEKKDKTG